MTDIVPELLEKIQKEFSEKLKNNADIARIEKLIKEGKATYIEAHEYADKVGEILAQCFRDNISSDSLPNGRMYYNIAERILNATLGHNYDLISRATAEMQKQLNKQNKISIKPQIPPKNQDRIDGIIDYVSNKDRYDDAVREYLEAHVTNYSLSVVDDSVRENAKFHYKAGIKAKIIRRSSGHCCDWCANLAGTYDYADVSDKSNEVFRRHPYCKCTVEYIPGNGRRENVWTHKVAGSEEDKRLREKQYEKWEKEREEKQKHKIITGHSPPPKRFRPNGIIDKKADDGKVTERAFYDSEGLKKSSIHTDNHGNPKTHSFGKHGEHVTEFYWNADGSLNRKTNRELTEKERSENDDILE